MEIADAVSAPPARSNSRVVGAAVPMARSPVPKLASTPAPVRSSVPPVLAVPASIVPMLPIKSPAEIVPAPSIVERGSTSSTTLAINVSPVVICKVVVAVELATDSVVQACTCDVECNDIICGADARVKRHGIGVGGNLPGEGLVAWKPRPIRRRVPVAARAGIFPAYSCHDRPPISRDIAIPPRPHCEQSPPTFRFTF